MLEYIFTGAACGAAVVSGIFWFLSAAVKVPDMTYESIEPGGSIARAVTKQANLNKYAASFASAAAILQAAAMAVKGH
jgi:hypothetical protein